MPRLHALVLASFLAQGCMHGLVNGNGTGRSDQGQCNLVDPCGSGTGEADGIVSIAVAGAMVGTVLFAVARRLLR